VRILLADDHALVRQGLAFFLRRLGREVAIVEAGTLEEAIAASARTDAIDLIILDLNMPGMGGLNGLDAVRVRRPDVPVVILSGAGTDADAREASARGAAGFIPKALSAEETLAALRLALAGERYFPQCLEPPDATAAAIAPGDGPLRALSPREREVLALLVGGHPNKEIARRLGLQEVTVKLHLKGLFRKLGASNRTQAVTTALRMGWDAAAG
jgi:two-component system, NarL family, nitrate/nitrite response regulator NarL